MNLEQTFIKKLENYFTEKYSDFDRKRIESFLLDYKQELNIQEKIVIKEVEVVREVKVYEKVNEIPIHLPLRQYKQLATGYVLQEEAKKLCEENNIEYKTFIKRSRRTRMNITHLRKTFCKYITDNYDVMVITLAEFFGLHHATICYYLHGSSYVRVTDRKQRIKVQRKYVPKSKIINSLTK